MFYLTGFLRTQAREAAFQVALRDCSQEAREESGYIGVLQQRPASWDIKRLLLMKENQLSQINGVSTFL